MDTGKTKLIKETREIKFDQAGVYAMAGPKQLPIVRRDQEPDAKPYNKGLTGTTEYAIWGKNNKYPQEVVDLNAQDTTSSACLKFKISAHYGKGLHLFKNVIDAKGHEIHEPVRLEDYPEIQDFFFLSEIETLQQGIITDYEYWNWCVTELIPNGSKNKIHHANRIPVVNCRLGKQNENGIIDKIHVSGEFGEAKRVIKTTPIDILNKRKFNFANPRIQDKLVYIGKMPSVDRQYYPLPHWHSNNKFLNLSLEISDWILSNINNSINIKYHIEYPQDYFEYICPQTAYKDDNDWLNAMKEEKEKLFQQIDEYLAGTSNVGKYIHTWSMRDPRDPSKEIGFKIHVIENKTNHEAYLPAFDTSAAAIANSHNAPLDLVGINLSKGMAGSGSNIRESFNFYMQLHTEVPRQTTLEWLYIVKKINKWPEDIHFGYRNIVFQSVNENKSGYAIEGEANPTSDQK